MISTNRTVFLGGDFNFVTSPEDSTKGKISNKNIVETWNEIETFRYLADLKPNCDDFKFTFEHRNKSGYQARLDRLYTNSKSFDPKVRIFPYKISPKDDHYPLLITSKPNPKRTKQWRLDPKILEDEGVQNQLSDLSKSVPKDIQPDDWLKYKEQAARLLERAQRERDQVNNFLIKRSYNKIKKLKKIAERFPEKLPKLLKAQKIYNTLVEEKQQNQKTLENLEWEMSLNWPSKVLSNFLTEKRTNRKLLVQENQTNNFFSDLYADKICDDDSMEKLFKEADLPKISNSENNQLAQPITEEEIWKAVEDLNKSSAPGEDKLTTKFYNRKWIGDLLFRLFNSWLNNGLHQSQAKAIIALLPKTDDPIRDPSQIRPISLLNKDYRIFMKVLANRIKPLLKSLIHPDQTGFVPERFIIDNISTVKLGVENLTKSNIITLLDCAKAFDRVGHKYLWATLEQYNLPKGLIDCLKETYRNSTSSIKLNGYVSEKSFQNSSGVRQGCPLAPFLFILSIEPLLRVLRKMSKGFRVAQQLKKVNAHADDIALFSLNEADQKIQLAIVNLWCKASGGQLNLKKCVSLTKIKKKETNQIK